MLGVIDAASAQELLECPPATTIGCGPFQAALKLPDEVFGKTPNEEVVCTDSEGPNKC